MAADAAGDAQDRPVTNREALAGRAGHLAERLGVPSMRLFRILERTCLDDPVSPWAGMQIFRPDFELALKHLPLDQVLGLFEQDKDALIQLGRREGACVYLTLSGIPLLSLPELHSAVASCIEYRIRPAVKHATIESGRMPRSNIRWPWDWIADALSGTDPIVMAGDAVTPRAILQSTDEARQDLRRAVRALYYDTATKLADLLKQALGKQDATGLWEACRDCLKSELSTDEIRRWFGHPIHELRLANGMLAYGLPSSFQGLIGVLAVIAHVIREIEIGAFNKTKQALDQWGARTGDGSWREMLEHSYYGVLNRPDRPALDGILDQFEELEGQGQEATRKLEQAINETLLDCASPVAPAFEVTTDAIHASADLGIATVDVPGEEVRLDGGLRLHPLVYQVPPGTTWGAIDIRFMDGETVRIEIGGMRAVRTYVELAMKSEKDGRPTVQWKLLESFAEGRGTYDWKSAGAAPKVKKRKELLARTLKDLFPGVPGEPIIWVSDPRIGKGWRTAFSIAPVQ